MSEATVLNATKAYGPFPRPSHQLGRTTVSDEHHRQRVQDWVEQRRRGRTATEIAREYGVFHQIVSRSTLGHGPFPSEDTVAAWVEARRQRRTLHEIGQEYRVPPHRIGHRTAASGPFPPPVRKPRLPEGLLGIAAIAVSQQSTDREMDFRFGRSFHFEVAAEFTARIVAELDDVPLPRGTLLNINVPGDHPRVGAGAAFVDPYLAASNDAVDVGLGHALEMAQQVIVQALPRRVFTMVLEWAMMHRPELRENWLRAERHEAALPIAPLDEEA